MACISRLTSEGFSRDHFPHESHFRSTLIVSQAQRYVRQGNSFSCVRPLIILHEPCQGRGPALLMIGLRQRLHNSTS